MRPFATLSRVEFALLMREPAAVLFTLGLPVILLMLNGGNGNRPDPALGGAGLIDILVPGFLVYVMATSALMAMIAVGVVLLVTVGGFAFPLTAPAGLGATVLAVTAAAASVLATGFLLGSLLPTVRTTQAVAAGLYFPAIFISGAVYPREAQPEFAQRIGDFLPLTYAVEAIKQAWTTGTVHWGAMGVLAGVTVVAVAVALRTFRWESR